MNPADSREGAEPVEIPGDEAPAPGPALERLVFRASLLDRERRSAYWRGVSDTLAALHATALSGDGGLPFMGRR